MIEYQQMICLEYFGFFSGSFWEINLEEKMEIKPETGNVLSIRMINNKNDDRKYNSSVDTIKSENINNNVYLNETNNNDSDYLSTYTTSDDDDSIILTGINNKYMDNSNNNIETNSGRILSISSVIKHELANNLNIINTGNIMKQEINTDIVKPEIKNEIILPIKNENTNLLELTAIKDDKSGIKQNINIKHEYDTNMDDDISSCHDISSEYNIDNDIFDEDYSSTDNDNSDTTFDVFDVNDIKPKNGRYHCPYNKCKSNYAQLSGLIY